MKKSSTFVAKLTNIVDSTFFSIYKKNLLSITHPIIYKSNMKRPFQFTLFALLILSTGLRAQVSSSKWQAQPIVIDGDGSDWGTLPRFFNAESDVKYEIRNDTHNLYIILKAADRTTQMQLLTAGFNIKLKVKTSPPIKVGINFPALKKGEMPPMILNHDGKTESLDFKSTTASTTMPKDTAILEGFQYSKGKIKSESIDEKNICFSRSKSSRELATYEIRIPLREIFGNEFILENVSANPIQLQVNINDLSQSDIKKMRGRQGRGMSGGMHGGGGRERGMGGQMGGMGGNGMESGGIGGSEIGEMPGSDMQNQMQGEMGGGRGFSMERKSFSLDFKLSNGK